MIFIIMVLHTQLYFLLKLAQFSLLDKNVMLKRQKIFSFSLYMTEYIHRILI